MSLLLSVFVVVAFAVIVERLALPQRAREVMARSSDSLAVLRNRDLTDAAKEEKLKRQSIRLFGLLVVLAGGSGLAIGLPLFIVWLVEQLGVSSLEAVLSMLLRVDFLATVTVGGTALYLAYRRIASR